jgi:hypothetical protein
MNWWSRPSTWAPQSYSIVWSREMDWIALAAMENEEDPRPAAKLAGVEIEPFTRRQRNLAAAASKRHWR